MNTVLAIMGPTAAGKTALACALAEYLPIHIISVDSAMIYRGMNIGTGKPSLDEQKRYPHALIDVVDPAESYSAARFCQDALREIAWAQAQQKLPVLVGGTMLYFKALLQGMAELPPSDEQVRTRLHEQLILLGNPILHERLMAVDPVSAQRIHPNDPQRMLRALEVYEISGRPLSSFFGQHQPMLTVPCLQVAVMPEQRQLLHPGIVTRFDRMLSNGLEQEVLQLQGRGDLIPDLPSMRCVGYRQMWDYLDGHLDFTQMREQAIYATQGLAKRQFTWLRDWPVALRLPDASANSLTQLLKALEVVPK